MLALLPLGRMNKRLTEDLPGRQGPCSSCVAAIGVFGQLFVWGMRHAGLVTTRHGGVTGSGHERHCARYWYCMEWLCLC
jgi:hypothetical protein